MENNYKTFYHLQIAKCGGTYLNNVIINQISDILLNNNIRVIDGQHHLGWKEKEKTYTVSCLRDPIKRTVSHYAYLYKHMPYEYYEDTSSFINWVKKYEKFISNYQIKNFLYTRNTLLKNPPNIFFPEEDKNFMLVELDKPFAMNRIGKIDILLKDNQLNDKTCENIGKKILKDFNIIDNIKINTNKNHNHNINKFSLTVYNNLTKKEIDYLYEINSLDSEIYFSEELYFNYND
jgi:hypothetical protein